MKQQLVVFIAFVILAYFKALQAMYGWLWRIVWVWTKRPVWLPKLKPGELEWPDFTRHYQEMPH